MEGHREWKIPSPFQRSLLQRAEILVAIKEIVYTEKFERDVKKVRDNLLKQKLEKEIRKILEDPESGKPLRYGLKGEWTIYVRPYRLIYAIQSSKLILLRFEHRKNVYE